MKHVFSYDTGNDRLQRDPARNGEILFLFIGGTHQLLHLAPVAAAMARLYPDVQVTCLHRDQETGEMLAEVRRSMRAWTMTIAASSPPRWSVMAGRWLRRPSIEKLPLLYRIARRHRNVRAIVAPERTSTHLRKLGMADARLIHFRHGAGDRAPRSENRLKHFDLIVVPGEKDIDRAVRKQNIAPNHLRQCGYVKLDYLAQLPSKDRPRLFADQRPIVLYNPHFDPRISSWHDARGVMEAFAGQDRYNLIVAPHIRIGEGMSAREIAGWEAMAVPGRIIVDLHSRRMVDMSYVLASDIYLGDVSSQLYEFLSKPRPAAFLNSHDVDWAENPRYAGWRLGEVANHVDDVLAAIDRAVAGHAGQVDRQRAAVADAFGDWRGACIRGAEIIGIYLGLEREYPANKRKLDTV